MSLLAHLLELRRRILMSLAGIATASVIGWFLYPVVTPVLFAPLLEAQGSAAGSGLNFRTVLAPLSTHLAFSAWAGLVASTPWWMTQLWLFVAPALARREKLVLGAVIAAASILFLCGVASAWLLLPRALHLLLSEVPASSSTLLDVDAYLSFTVTLTLVVGLSFLFPVLIVGANALGVLPVHTIVRHWRWAVMGAFTFAAITNPLPDAWSMILQAGVLLALHHVAVGICALREWRARLRTGRVTGQDSVLHALRGRLRLRGRSR